MEGRESIILRNVRGFFCFFLYFTYLAFSPSVLFPLLSPLQGRLTLQRLTLREYTLVVTKRAGLHEKTSQTDAPF
jgi:hypothetical protein